jgi:monofunctional biosynthetic peptidoglycan transglycosylase
VWPIVGRASVGAAAVGFACLAYSWFRLPDVRPLITRNPTSTAFMRLRADEAGRAHRPAGRVQRWLPYSRISPLLSRAVLVAEDARFWSHDGVDLDELQESLEVDWARGRFTRGGSTITQQLAKNLYLTPSRNPYRKLVELLIARRLEAELSKARILEIYLNVIEWGDDIWGAEAAARAYFHRSSADLTAPEAALLAGAIINPHRYSPARPNARLRRRQQMILERMGAVTPPAPIEPAAEGPADRAPLTIDPPAALVPLPLPPARP